MVFSTIPAYLDPANWQQQPNFQTAGSSELLPPQHQPPIPPPPPPQPYGVGGSGSGSGSIRPGSMVDRARMANIPMPETALKCPRCESTQTKFCYFNNYSLSQPRHFCKTCRRYWTRGGALRSVPVGGGCRRNKRSSKGSSSSSKSEPASSETANSGSTSSTLLSNTSTPATTTSILGGLTSQFPQLRFMSPLTHLTNYDSSAGTNELGLNYGRISAPVATATSETNFQIGSNLFSGGGNGATVASLLPSIGGGSEQWRMQEQFPNFVGGFDPSLSQAGMLYNNNNYQGEGVDHQATGSGYVGAKLSNSTSMMSQLQSAVKMEMNNNNINIHKQDQGQSSIARVQFSGPIQGNERHWSSGSTTAWTNLSGFSSSSTSSAL